jgi:hypothetical protein
MVDQELPRFLSASRSRPVPSPPNLATYWLASSAALALSTTPEIVRRRCRPSGHIHASQGQLIAIYSEPEIDSLKRRLERERGQR